MSAKQFLLTLLVTVALGKGSKRRHDGTIKKTPLKPPPNFDQSGKTPAHSRLIAQRHVVGMTPNHTSAAICNRLGVYFTMQQKTGTPSKPGVLAQHPVSWTRYNMFETRNFTNYRAGDDCFLQWTRFKKKQGIYRHLDKDKNVVYIGKAANERERASGHLAPDSTRIDTALMTQPIMKDGVLPLRERIEAGKPPSASSAEGVLKKALSMDHEIIFLEVLLLEDWKKFWRAKGVSEATLKRWDIEYMEAWALKCYKDQHSGRMPKYNDQNSAARYEREMHPDHIHESKNIRVNYAEFSRMSPAEVDQIVRDDEALEEGKQILRNIKNKPRKIDSGENAFACKIPKRENYGLLSPIAGRLPVRVMRANKRRKTPTGYVPVKTQLDMSGSSEEPPKHPKRRLIARLEEPLLVCA